MPRKRTYLGLYVGLASEDRKRLAEIAKAQGKTKTDVARKAIIEYLDRVENRDAAEDESKVATAIKRMENRIAGLMARSAIDIGTIYQVLWLRSDPAKRKELFDKSRAFSIQRLNKKLEAEEVQIKERIVDEISSQT